MATILGIISILLMLGIIFQIGKASDLLYSLKGEEASMESANKIHSTLFLVFLFVGMTAAIWSTYHYSPLYLPEPSSVHGVWLRNMFFWTLLATVPVFILAHIALFWFAFRYSKDKNPKPYYFSHSNKLELIWTSVPAVVMVLLVYEGMHNWYKITEPAPKDAMIVEATAQQFKWTFRYAGGDNELGTKSITKISNNNELGQIWSDKSNHDDFITTELHLPKDKPVLIKINSIDVLHSFFLPHFRVKMDAVPGLPTQFHFIPTKTTAEMRTEFNDPEFNYELACAELCGQAHYNMRRVVVVEEEAEFEKWLKEQKSTYQQKKADGSLGMEYQDHYKNDDDTSKEEDIVVSLKN